MQRPGWNVIEDKETWVPTNYISITTERCLERIDRLAKERVKGQDFAVFHAVLWEKKEMDGAEARQERQKKRVNEIEDDSVEFTI